jgi:hypothetical protein
LRIEKNNGQYCETGQACGVHPVMLLFCAAAQKYLSEFSPGVTMALNNVNDLNALAATKQLRRPYSPPKLTALGSFAKLTRDAAKSNYTDMSQMPSMQ